jgi:CheY-like chemotaxis protein
MNPKRILVVDDNPVVVKALEGKLQSCGYEVLTAEDGAAAVSTVRMARPDLVLLDISFPPDVAHGGGVAWDGFLIMTWLGRMEEAQGIPIVILSGCEAEQYEEKALAAGAVRYLQKPVDPDELIAVIREVLGENVEAPYQGS